MLVTSIVEVLIVLKENEAEIIFRKCQLELLHLASRKFVTARDLPAET